MAFCNSCGTPLDANTKFCVKCGSPNAAAVAAAAPPAVAPQPPAAAPSQGSGILKIVLIAFAVIAVLGVLCIGTFVYFVHRAVKSTHVVEKDGTVKVESPFGSIESNTDAGKALEDTGVDAYPGAVARKEGSSSLEIAGTKTVVAVLETEDSPSKVADFYHARFPKAAVSTTEGDHFGVVSTEPGKFVTVSIEPQDGKTVITITTVTGKHVTSTTTTTSD